MSLAYIILFNPLQKPCEVVKQFINLVLQM